MQAYECVTIRLP